VLQPLKGSVRGTSFVDHGRQGSDSEQSDPKRLMDEVKWNGNDPPIRHLAEDMTPERASTFCLDGIPHFVGCNGKRLAMRSHRNRWR